LPSLTGKRVFRVVHEHYVEVGGFSGSFVCAFQELKKPCRICLEAKRLKTSGNPLDYSRGDDMYPRKRIYVNAVNRDDADNTGPVVHVLPGVVHEYLRNFNKKFPDEGSVTDPENGFDVLITRTGTGKKDTRYSTDIARRPSSLCDDMDLADEWIQNQADLDRFARIRGDEEIEAALSSEGGAEAPAGTEEPRGARDVGRGSGTPSGREAAPAAGRASSRGRSEPAARRTAPATARGRRAEDDVVDAEYTDEDK
jgi:hypothetical protein